jgi:hypothetical protein
MFFFCFLALFTDKIMLTRCCKCISCTCRANNNNYLIHLSTFLQLILEKLHILVAVRVSGLFDRKRCSVAQSSLSPTACFNVFFIMICPWMEAVKGGCTGYSGRSCSAANYTVPSIPAQISPTPPPPPDIRFTLSLLCSVVSTE